MQKIGKFNAKISVIPNGLDFNFYDSMQRINSSLDALVKNFSAMDSKLLLKEFRDELLELVKQKGLYPYEYMSSFKRFFYDRLYFFLAF